MKVWIDRDTCEANLATCLSCFGQLVRTGVPDRACIMDYEDDGSEDMIVYMHSEGQDREPLVIPKEMRELVAYEGWTEFVDFEPRFRKNEGAERAATEKVKKADILDALSDRIKQFMHRKKATGD
jgi:hypothetical protein